MCFNTLLFTGLFCKTIFYEPVASPTDLNPAGLKPSRLPISNPSLSILTAAAFPHTSIIPNNKLVIALLLLIFNSLILNHPILDECISCPKRPITDLKKQHACHIYILLYTLAFIELFAARNRDYKTYRHLLINVI